jgi:hypothetical protein
VTAFAAAMRAHLALVGPAALLACALAPGRAAKTVAPPATTSRTSEPAQVQVATPRAPAAGQEPAEPVDAAARVLGEVQAMDLAASWAWAVATMPELAEHREAGATPTLWAEFRRLAADRTTLWVRARGERCFPVRGAWEDDRFYGRAREVAEVAGDRKTVRFETVDITEIGIVSSGPHGDEFLRDARGRWQKTDGFGFGLGSFATLADRPVFEVTRKAAYYGDDAYGLTIECNETSVQEDRCTDGTTRRCRRCSGLGARPHAQQRVWFGLHTTITGASERRVDCSVPCPPDLHTPQLAALNWAVQGRTFIEADEPDAAVYTDARTCRGDPRMR